MCRQITHVQTEYYTLCISFPLFITCFSSLNLRCESHLNRIRSLDIKVLKSLDTHLLHTICIRGNAKNEQKSTLRNLLNFIFRIQHFIYKTFHILTGLVENLHTLNYLQSYHYEYMIISLRIFGYSHFLMKMRY